MAAEGEQTPEVKNPIYDAIKGAFQREATADQQKHASQFAGVATLVAKGLKPSFLWGEKKGPPTDGLVRAINAIAGLEAIKPDEVNLLVTRAGEAERYTELLRRATPVDPAAHMIQVGLIFGYLAPGTNISTGRALLWLIWDESVEKDESVRSDEVVHTENPRLLFNETVPGLLGIPREQDTFAAAIESRREAFISALAPKRVTLKEVGMGDDLRAAFKQYADY